MLRNPKVPLLPGHVISDNLRREFHLPHNWNHVQGTPLLVEKQHSNTSYETRDKIFTKSKLYPPQSESQTPDWLNYNRKILCFSAYAKHETLSGETQIHQVKILYYLEDSSIQVIEPRVENSGFSQGCIVARQQVPRKGSDGREILTVLDFNVQETVNIFDVNYVLVDCDTFTRKFLRRAGIEVLPPIEMPADRAQVLQKRMNEVAQPEKPSASQPVYSKMERFLQLDSKVLRFNAIWDDRNAIFGDLHELIVCYYLVDDTIQINSVKTSKKFLNRQRLPKHFDGFPMLGEVTNLKVLNVLGGGFLTGRYIADRQGVEGKQIEYVTDKDLNIGKTLDVYGRNVLIVDCDAFTREHYRRNYGIEEMPSIAEPSAACNRPKNNIERKLPPFNGWGSHENSEENCKKIILKTPLSDYTKFLKYGNSRLRFGAKMESTMQTNALRSFIIAYYLVDDTISVYETDGRNSGFKNGDFYSRRKFYLPNQEWFSSDRPQQYLSSHFFIGATVCLKDFFFNLTSADEFTFRHMELLPFEYPMANIELIMQKIRTAVEPQYKEFVGKYLSKSAPSATGDVYICFSTMRYALVDLLGSGITDHEIVTFLRYFAVESATNGPTGRCSRNTIRSLVQLELIKNLWDDMARLKEHLYHLHPNQMDGFLPKNELQTIVKACRLPLPNDLILKMLAVLKRNEAGELDVHDFLYFIDYFTHKATPIQPANLYELCHKDNYFHSTQLIDWNRFIEKLDLEKNLKRQTD